SAFIRRSNQANRKHNSFNTISACKNLFIKPLYSPAAPSQQRPCQISPPQARIHDGRHQVSVRLHGPGAPACLSRRRAAAAPAHRLLHGQRRRQVDVCLCDQRALAGRGAHRVAVARVRAPRALRRGDLDRPLPRRPGPLVHARHALRRRPRGRGLCRDVPHRRARDDRHLQHGGRRGCVGHHAARAAQGHARRGAGLHPAHVRARDAQGLRRDQERAGRECRHGAAAVDGVQPERDGRRRARGRRGGRGGCFQLLQPL
ncbi:MAG: hypothetical protein J3K34DRAFT_290986, partial [Monoraphidium minutum]